MTRPLVRRVVTAWLMPVFFVLRGPERFSLLAPATPLAHIANKLAGDVPMDLRRPGRRKGPRIYSGR
jgi:hypothetical protein